MQCKVVQESSSVDAGEMALSDSPRQESNVLFPHQVGSVDSCSSWPGHVWRRELSKYWLDADTNNNNQSFARDSKLRVSCSSDCSDSSVDDFNLSDYSEDSDNAILLGKEKTTTRPKSCIKEDQNNNIEQDNNNNNKNTTNNNISNSINNKNISIESRICKTNSTKKSDNPSRERLLDDEGYIRRAACVCLDETESKVLLVSSKKDPCSWLVPGGGMEAGEEMATAAIREAWEEAGVQGQITRYLGLFETKHQDGNKKHRTAVFVVSVKQVMADYPEAYLGRGRQWFTIEEALLHLARTRPLQSAYLQLLLVSRLKVAVA